ncbi:MAG TPA: hypothetical protein VL947_13325 [Cytophagales bacterium]|nr:hypothetical protein [Cytophagales bacterium]
MKISGFTIIRNGVKLDYPFIESIQSILPVCDEFIVCIGQCEDATASYIKQITDTKIKIIHSPWNLENRVAGTELAIQTNIAMQHITGDWGFYIQADEVLPDGYQDKVRESCERYLNDSKVEGLLFDYVHFYGNYNFICTGRSWYRREVRVIRNHIGIQSYADAQGFRVNERKINAKKINVPMYHYGHVRKPEGHKNKNFEMSKLWHSDQEISNRYDISKPFIYENTQTLKPFSGRHPKLMEQRISEVNWQFIYDPKTVRRKIKDVILDKYEALTGRRLFEFKNYKII